MRRTWAPSLGLALGLYVLLCIPAANCFATLAPHLNCSPGARAAFCSVQSLSQTAWTTRRTLSDHGLVCLRSQADGEATPHKSASVTGRGTRVCIVGGGFGGLYTALQLAQLQPLQAEEDRAKITLVDESERFVFLPLLYELVTGELKDWEVAPVFVDLLKGTDIEFVHGKLSSLDHRTRSLSVDLAPLAGGGSRQVQYDKLVLATGASAAMPPDAAAAGALPFMRVEDAKELRARLGQLRFTAARRSDERRRAGKPERPAIAIVGGGYSGVELACSLAETVGKWADVKLLHRGDTVMAGSTRFNRITSYQELRRRGVALSTSADVSEITKDSMTVRTVAAKGATEPPRERREAFDILVWTAGTASNALVEVMPTRHPTPSTIPPHPTPHTPHPTLHTPHPTSQATARTLTPEGLNRNPETRPKA
jgi:NADH dehydrogenase FAD-containing subunit